MSGKAVIDKLLESLKLKTISCHDPSQVDVGEFKKFHLLLEEVFPLIHKNLKRERINDLSLLYTWEGSDTALKPAILMAHMDVAPISPGTEGDWDHPPFEGVIDEEFIWGRGTLDCKGFLFSIMEAVETLLVEEFKPNRTIYLAFGHDEEVGGWEGAHNTAQLLESQKIRAEYVLDEGGFIVDGEPLHLKKQISAIGISEKGRLDLKLQVQTEGGHSSMPPRHTSIGILSSAINQLEKKQLPATLQGIVMQTFNYLSPEMPSSFRFVFKNKWLFGKLIKYALSTIKATNGMIRTTFATTIIEGGTLPNVIPQIASANVNLRLLPGHNIDMITSKIRKKIKDPKVEVIKTGISWEASPVSSLESEGFNILKTTIEELFPETVIAPFLVVGGTDSKHFTGLSDSIYRFGPLRVGKDDQERAHGTNERITIVNFMECIEFYKKMIKNS